MGLDVVSPQTFRAGDLVPLTWQQRVIWYQSLLDPDSTRYHYHALFHFDRSPDPAALNRELSHLARRHRVLLTRLAYRDGEPCQVYPDVVDADRLVIDEVRLAEQPPTSVELVVRAGANQPFNLQTGPLLRWTLVWLPDGKAVLVHTEHHLVHDGMSFVTLVESLSGRAERFELDGAYFRYAAEQNAGPHPDAAAVAERFAAAPHLPRLDHPAGWDPALRLPVPTSLVAAARATAKTEGVSLFTVLFTAFAEAVHRSWGPVVMGTAVANRPPGHDRTVGMFVSTVPVSIADEARMSLPAMSTAIDAAVRGSDIPISDVVAALPPGETDRHGLVSVGFSLHEQHGGQVMLAGVPSELEIGISPGAAKFPVNVVALVDGADHSGVTLLIDGQAEYVDHDRLWALWSGFVECLVELCGLPLREPTDHEPAPTDVVTAVRRIAEEERTRIAVRDESTAVSYGELVRLGDDVRWCAGGAVVGLLGGASARFFAAAYAVLHVGGTYVPLDAGQPTEGLAHIIRQSGCHLVVDLDESTTPSHPELVEVTSVRRVSWEQFRAPRSQAEVPEPTDLPADLAYLIFTSGSTGIPKGVRVRRTSLSWLSDWASIELGLGRGTVISQVANIGFDASVWELWPALYCGAELVVVPEAVRGDPAMLAEWLVAQRVEVAFAPTPIAEMLMALPWPGSSVLRVLGAGGDQLHLSGSALPFEVINLYGPTEGTVVSASQWVDPRDTAPPPIGPPLPYCSVTVVAEDGSRVPDGQLGELWLGGAGVADGYANAPELTRPRFVPNPHSPDGAIVYRTGDLVRRASDGTLTFCGRQDRQVKVSGVRIELAEVEATALRRPEVRHAVAVTTASEPGVRRLSLAVVPTPDADEPDLVDRIRTSLPAYLRHIAIRCVSTLPLNSNGKVNLNILSTSELSTSESAAGDALDAALAFARSALGTDELDRSWFSAGGSSLDAARLVTRLTSELSLTATVRDLLEATSVRAYLTGLAKSAPGTTPKAHQSATSPCAIRRVVSVATPPVHAPVSAVDVLWSAMSELPPNEKLRLANMLIGAASEDIWPE
jgi:amino acid adenylation domain-containing protein